MVRIEFGKIYLNDREMRSSSHNHCQIFAVCTLCKSVQDYYIYRNSFNIMRCENNSN